MLLARLAVPSNADLAQVDLIVAWLRCEYAQGRHAGIEAARRVAEEASSCRLAG
jgi:hypothetical protein